MVEMSITTSDEAQLIDSTVDAAANLDIHNLEKLLRSCPANVQSSTNVTPLIAALSSFDKPDAEAKSQQDPTRLQKLGATLRLLLLNGAVWNETNLADETPGCVALRLGLKDAYEIIVEAGVRAELLFGAMKDLGMDADSESSEEGPMDDEPPSDVNSSQYLASTLRFSSDRILDEDANAVMMSWESEIMRKSAAALLSPYVDDGAPQEVAENVEKSLPFGPRILNIGAGMSIIDRVFQEYKPSSHHIIEAHPEVLSRLAKDGWHQIPGVEIQGSKWQDVVAGLVDRQLKFDAIYFDTFAEDYDQLRSFFKEWVPQLLNGRRESDSPGGTFGFFNGLGADRQVCYDVYVKVVEAHLEAAGFTVAWESISVPDLRKTGEWSDVRRAYWIPQEYRLPTCRLKS